MEIKVRDDDGKFQGASVVGEICIRTPRIMKGYAGREDDSALPDGWRATGDLGWVDEEGYVFFAGRKDDMIIRGGENIAPAEIETVLMSHPAIDEVAIIGVPSVEWGQVVKAFVVKRARRKCQRERADRVLPQAAFELQMSRDRSSSSTRCRKIRSAKSCAKNCARCSSRGDGDGVKKSRSGAVRASKVGKRQDRDRGRMRHRDSDVVRPIGNRVSAAMATELMELFERVEDDGDIAMLAITGAGEIFCGGFDADVNPNLVESLAVLSKPTVAIVNGDATDEGMELAMAADIRIALADARFALTQPSRGEMPRFGGHAAAAEAGGYRQCDAHAGRGRATSTATKRCASGW